MSARAVSRRLSLATMASTLIATATIGAVAMPSADEQLPTADVEMREFDPQDFAAQAERLPEDLVRAIERDLDLSPEQYLARAAAARVATDVVDSLDDAVSAAWLDGRTLHVAVRSRSDEALASATGAVVHVGDALTDAATAARGQGRIVYVDRAGGKVVPVETEIEPQSMRSAHLPARPDPSEGGALRGGFGFWSHDALFAYGCTGGFNGVTADGRNATLTAGHCAEGESGPLERPVGLLGLSLLDLDEDEAADPPDDDHLLDHDHDHDEPDNDVDVDADGPDGEDEFGRFVDGAVRLGDGEDTAILDITDTAWTTRAEVSALNADLVQRDGLAIYDSMVPLAGAPACSSGVTSGWTCGRILDAESTVQVGEHEVAGFMFSACTLPGDGGGPIVVGNYALGTNSGSTWTDTDCDESNGGSPHVSLGYAVSGGERNAHSAHNGDWSLSIHVGTPEITAPVEGDVTGTQPTIRGRIDAAAGTIVTVEVDGTDPVEASVRADGRWRAPVDESLAPGRHSYRVAATHTAAAAAEPTSSEIVTGTFEVAEVAALVVATPAPGESTQRTRPRFSGTGEPGARISLDFDDQTTRTVVDDDGTWTITPREARRAGRFDALVTQESQGATDEVAIDGLGIVPGAPLISDATDDATGGHVIMGTALPRGTIAVRVQRAAPDEATDPATAVSEHIAQADESGGWQVRLIDMPAGEYSVSAVQAIDDLTSERSAQATLVVTGLSSHGIRGADPDDDLAETGGVPMAFIALALVLVSLGSAGLAWRRRQP